MEKHITISKIEQHFGAILVKTVGLEGILEHHWFAPVDGDKLEYTGFTAYAENVRTGELERVENEQDSRPKEYVVQHARRDGYNIIEQ